MGSGTENRFTLASSLDVHKIVIALAALAVVWVLFFDSHSLLKRIQWHWEAQSIAAENERLRQEIESVQRQLEALESDATIEELAREEYGMHRPGETVYKVELEN